jgi:hypothetical protein
MYDSYVQSYDLRQDGLLDQVRRFLLNFDIPHREKIHLERHQTCSARIAVIEL